MWNVIFLIAALCSTVTSAYVHNCTYYDRKTCNFESLQLPVSNINNIYPDYGNYPNNEDGLHEYNMIDYKHKILMTFVPKAACTKSVMIFFSGMNYFYGVNYTGFAHNFKNDYQNHCGIGSPCLLSDNSWFKFKVVRNPFDRAVSSYLTVTKNNSILPLNHKMDPYLILNKKGRENISFHMFIDILLSETKEFWNFDCAGHVEKQISRHEKLRWSRNESSPYNLIIKSENFNSDWKKISQLTNVNYTVYDDPPPHLFKRSNSSKAFVGDTPRNQFVIPLDYGLFYNEITRAKVTRLFSEDLLIYNYTFPF